MPLLTLPTGRLHYLDEGRGAPLILLSANPGESRDYAAVTPALAQRYRVLALDWPGYGASDPLPHPERTTVLDFYRVLREFMDALGIASALFIGNSVGGNVAARLAIESPERVRGLVLVAPGGFTPHNFVTRAFCRLMGSRFALSPRRWAALYLRKKNAPVVQQMLERAATVQATPESLALNRALWRSFGGSDNDLRAAAGRIRAPTLLFFGRDDPAISAGKDGKVAARCIAQARFVAMPCGHAAFAETPELFLREVLSFLSSIGANAER